MSIPERDHLPQKELIRAKELFPRSGVVDALRGTISEPVTTISRKKGKEGKSVSVRLVENGSGQFGLTGMQDNKEWSGIFHHSILSARYSVHFGNALQKAAVRGEINFDETTKPNLQTMLDGMIVSHAGRRTWDEAGWYPDVVKEAARKRAVSNETIGLLIIQDKVPEDAFKLVTALAHKPEGFEVDPAVKKGWSYRITSYVDHRTTDHWQPLHERLGDFLYGNFLDDTAKTPAARDAIRQGIKEIIQAQKKYTLGEEGAQAVTIDSADARAESLGADEGSPRLTRKDFMELVLQDAETEAVLQHLDIDTENINDATVPMAKWEKDLRKDYVKAAEKEIVPRISELHKRSKQWLKRKKARKQLQEEFPLQTWWGQAATELYEKV